jgi:hypothetical protein
VEQCSQRVAPGSAHHARRVRAAEGDSVSDEEVPAELRPLLGLAPEWAWPLERQRQEKRASSSLQQLDAFHAALRPQLLAIGRYLDSLSTRQLSADQQALFRLALMYMEAAPAVEAYRAAETPVGYPRQKFVNPSELVSSI